MRKIEPAERVRGAGWPNPVRSYRDRHGRRARALAALLDGDDDEVVVRPWDLRLPRTVILAAARNRGLEPVSGTEALAQRGPWLEPMHFTRVRDAGIHPTGIHPTGSRSTGVRSTGDYSTRTVGPGAR
ncbi:hypothetical protein [Dietzia psychralcaliphila]|uniref:hypothetical protein n=1 Tax=Dietzia psychralcaliphila TaxID=139021 RepID=UPI000D4F3182|nr:hypothetical protein [Dietzia psychralcaliphila]PTM86054.1 hypothetical protein C8N39_10810 [Dietzia psychralcaliphila]